MVFICETYPWGFGPGGGMGTKRLPLSLLVIEGLWVDDRNSFSSLVPSSRNSRRCAISKMLLNSPCKDFTLENIRTILSVSFTW